MAAMYDAFSFHPDNPKRLADIPASVRLWAARKDAMNNRMHCVSVLKLLICSPRRGIRHLRAKCGGVDEEERINKDDNWTRNGRELVTAYIKEAYPQVWMESNSTREPHSMLVWSIMLADTILQL
jgi:hypothetical protein